MSIKASRSPPRSKIYTTSCVHRNFIESIRKCWKQKLRTSFPERLQVSLPNFHINLSISSMNSAVWSLKFLIFLRRFKIPQMLQVPICPVVEKKVHSAIKLTSRPLSSFTSRSDSWWMSMKLLPKFLYYALIGDSKWLWLNLIRPKTANWRLINCQNEYFRDLSVELTWRWSTVDKKSFIMNFIIKRAPFHSYEVSRGDWMLIVKSD